MKVALRTVLQRVELIALDDAPESTRLHHDAGAAKGARAVVVARRAQAA